MAENSVHRDHTHEEHSHGSSTKRNRAKHVSAGSAPASWAAGCASTPSPRATRPPSTTAARTSPTSRRCSSRGRHGPTRPSRWPRIATSCSPSSAFPRTCARCSSGRKGALAGSKPGTILVDMTTSEPSLAQEIYDAAKAKGVYSLDAPVSGGDVGAKNAALSIMIGGDKDVVEAVNAALRVHGQDDRPPGAGRRRPAHQDGQPDPDRLQHGRRLRRRCSTATRRGSTSKPSSSRSPSARPAAGRWNSSARASWPATSSRASSSSTSSRTWASPWTKPRRWASPCPGLALAHQLYIAAASAGLWPQGNAGADAGAGAYFRVKR